MAADTGLGPITDNQYDPAEMVAEGVALVDALERAGATARLLGGVGIALHSAPAGGPVTPHRRFDDIDLIADRRDLRIVKRVFASFGCEANARFNALNGRERLMYFGRYGHIDVLTDFNMCHSIDLRRRLALDSPTLTVSDLLLTKLQVWELNEKDLSDVVVLLNHHELGGGEGDVVNVAYIASVLSDDWGFWRTLTGNLGHVVKTNPGLADKVDSLRGEIDHAPKSLRFRARAKVGERKRWYKMPEESVR